MRHSGTHEVARGAAPHLTRRALLRAAGAAVAGGVGAAALAACGSSGGQPSAAQYPVKFVYSGDDASQARMQAYLDDYRKSAGDQVSLVGIGNYYTENVQAMVSAGVPPDALSVSRPEFDALWSAGKLTDLTSLLAKSGQGGAFFPVLLQEWERNGKQLALPLGFRTLAVAYNSNAFQTGKTPPPPARWNGGGWRIDDFAKAAAGLSFPGSASEDPQYGFYVDPTYLVWSAFVLDNGGEVLDSQGRTVQLDQPAALAALAALQKVLLTSGVEPPADLVAQDGGANIFSNGSLVMTVTDPSTIPERQRDSHFPWDIGVLPGDGAQRLTTGSGAGYALVAGSRQSDAAWKLVQYLTSEGVQAREAQAGQWIPSRPAVATSSAYLPEQDNIDLLPQHMRVFVDALTEGRVRLQPSLRNWSAVRNALEAGVQDLWTGKMQPAEAAQHAKAITEPLLREG